MSSSSVGGFMSSTLNASLAFSSDQRLMRRSSADRNVAPSEHAATELMWYACALPYTRRGVAIVALSPTVTLGTRNAATGTRPP